MAIVVPISVGLFCCRDRNEALTTIQIPSERREERRIIDQCCSLTWPVLIATLGAPTEQVGADSCGWWVVLLLSHWQRRLLCWLPIIKKKKKKKKKNRIQIDGTHQWETDFSSPKLECTLLTFWGVLCGWFSYLWYTAEQRARWVQSCAECETVQYTARYDVELQREID